MPCRRHIVAQKKTQSKTQLGTTRRVYVGVAGNLLGSSGSVFYFRILQETFNKSVSAFRMAFELKGKLLALAEDPLVKNRDAPRSKVEALKTLQWTS
eukprot:g19642.t1